MRQVYSTVEDFISKSVDDNTYWSSRADDIGSLNGIIEKQAFAVVSRRSLQNSICMMSLE